MHPTNTEHTLLITNYITAGKFTRAAKTCTLIIKDIHSRVSNGLINYAFIFLFFNISDFLFINKLLILLIIISNFYLCFF